MRLVCVISFAILLVGCERKSIYEDTQLLPEKLVELEQVLRWANDKGVVWVDARSRKDYDKGHVEGALLLNEMEDFYKLLEPIWSEIQEKADLPFIVYCSSKSYRASHKVSEKLFAPIGVSRVYILKDGLKSLIDSGLIK